MSLGATTDSVAPKKQNNVPTIRRIDSHASEQHATPSKD
jgi:hypothetical protein